MRRRPRHRDERGTTLIELLVALAAGIVVLAALTHGHHRHPARDQPGQRPRRRHPARAHHPHKMIEELHSACIAPQIAPVQRRQHRHLAQLHPPDRLGGRPHPGPQHVSLTGSTLSQSDYAVTGGTAPNWNFADHALHDARS